MRPALSGTGSAPVPAVVPAWPPGSASPAARSQRGAGIGGLSFFAVWMDRYQPYLIAVTLLLLLWWLGRTIRTMTAGNGGGPWWRLARAGRPALVHAAVCLGSYGLVLALAMGISAAARGM